LEKITMILATSVISYFRRIRGNKQGSGGRSQMVQMFVPAFKWLNRLYCLPARLDNWAMPRPLSAVLLVRSTKLVETHPDPDLIAKKISPA